METPMTPMTRPCVKLEYKGDETTYHNEPKGKMARYLLLFSNPPKVIVQEEYLIYDGIALISAVGGTMGLCIGFSFYNLTHSLFAWIEKIKLTFASQRAKKLKVTKATPMKIKSLKEVDQGLNDICAKALLIEMDVAAIMKEIDSLRLAVENIKEIN